MELIGAHFRPDLNGDRISLSLFVKLARVRLSVVDFVDAWLHPTDVIAIIRRTTAAVILWMRCGLLVLIFRRRFGQILEEDRIWAANVL